MIKAPVAWRVLGCAFALLLAVQGCSEAPQGGQSRGPGGKGPPPPPVVAVAPVQDHEFVQAIEAVGTAFARENVTITANVTERVKRLNFSDGAYVTRGQILVELAAAEEGADLDQARAQLREADLQLKRVQSLARDGFASRSRLDEQIAERDGLRAQVDSLSARIADRVIRAPFSGVVGLRRVSPGMVATMGTPILELSDLSLIKLDFSIPETSLGALRAGQEIRAQAAAFPGEAFAGRVETIDPQIDPVTRAAQVRALIPNPTARLKPGMLMTVQIVQSVRRAPALPERAIIGLRDESAVLVYDSGSKTVRRLRVTLGQRDPGYVEIRSELPPGAQIVVDGVEKAQDGQTVTLTTEAGMRPAVAQR
jgi:membrane fusion protein, multidrug efflux system